MVLQKTAKLFSYTALCSSLFASVAFAKGYPTNMVKLQAMDKITGRVSEIEAPVNAEVQFGSFSIVVRKCMARPPEETPENTAFVDVVDNYDGKNPVNIFKGWMFSSSPALNAVEHPIYDVWLQACFDGDVNRLPVLSAKELAERDKIAKALPKESPLKKETIEEHPVKDDDVEVKTTQNPQETENVEKESDVTEALVLPSDVDLVSDMVVEEGAPKPLLPIVSSVKKDTLPILGGEETSVPENEEVVTEEYVIEEDDAGTFDNVFPEADKIEENE